MERNDPRLSAALESESPGAEKGQSKDGCLWGVIILLLIAVYPMISDEITGERVAREIRASGVPARAKILAVQEMGILMNEKPLVTIVLEVHPKDAPPYEAKTTTLVSVLNAPAFQVGNMLWVKYDPADPQRVAISYGSPE
jgi:hypothetical protein